MIILPFKDKYPKIAKTAFIANNAVIIGDVEIGEYTSVWYGCVIRGDVNYIKIGNETNIQDNTTIHVHRNNGPTIIGNRVTIGHKVLLHACILEDSTFIGMGSSLIDYSHMESNSMIGANSLLSPNKRIKSNELWIGSPAKVWRMLDEREIEHIQVSASNYVQLSKEYINYI